MAFQIIFRRRRLTIVRKVKQKPPVARLSPEGYLKRCARLTALGLTVVAGGAYIPAAKASGPTFGSPGWYSQKFQNGKVAAPTGTAAAGGLSSVTTATQAQSKAAASIANLSLAAKRIADMQAAQLQAAQRGSSSAATVPNGLGSGGLDPNTDTSNGGAWINAAAPTEANNQTTDASGNTTVTVTQSSDRAVMTWNSFNVGSKTTLHIDQSAGNQTNGDNSWIAVNRITGGAPSTILGSIKAEGTVYVLNPNGILFGAGSQVNTHSFLATTLGFLDPNAATSNDLFVNQREGLLSLGNNATQPQAVLVDTLNPWNNKGGTVSEQTTGGTYSLAVDSPAAIKTSSVTVESGATIQTDAQGFSLLAAPTVINQGTIRADDGQAMLVAGFNVAFAPVNTGTADSASLVTPYAVGAVQVNDVSGDATPTLAVTNSGIISAARGNVTLTGSDVFQNGVVAVSTSLTGQGSINISAQDEYTLTSGSEASASSLRTGLVSIGAAASLINLPDEDGETTTSSYTATQGFKAGTINVDGGAITLGNNAQVEMPGGAVKFSATAAAANNTTASVLTEATLGRVFLDANSIIDVSGLADVALALDSTLVSISRIGQNELADSPTQRDGVLYTNKFVVIDANTSGTRSDGVNWVGSPLLNVSGYVEDISRNVDQLLLNGGSVTLSGDQVLTQAGSKINVDAGYSRYMAGYVAGESRLLDSQGHVVQISKADSLDTYSGLAGVYSQQSGKGSTRTYIDPLLSGRLKHYDPGYIVGGDGGTLDINLTGFDSVSILNGDLSAQSYAGRKQVASGKLPDGSNFVLTDTQANKNDLSKIDLAVTFEATSLLPQLNQIAANFNANSSLQTSEALAKDPTTDLSDYLYWSALSGTQLSEAGFSNVTVSNVAQVVVQNGGGLTVQPGGSINLTANRIQIDDNLTAQGGSISLTAGLAPGLGISGKTFATGPVSNDIVIGSESQIVTLSTRGRWVNDFGLGADSISGSANLDGGSISITTNASNFNGSTDTSGSIDLSNGILDVSGGGRINQKEAITSSNGLAYGKGGNISLSTYALFQTDNGTQAANVICTGDQCSAGAAGRIIGINENDSNGIAHLLGYGFSSGGSLSIHGLDIQIGGSQPIYNQYIWLDPTFFQTGGFSSYNLAALWDASVNEAIHVQEQNFILPNRGLSGAIYTAATGTDIYQYQGTSAFGAIGVQNNAYAREAANLNISSGEYLTDKLLQGGVNFHTAFDSAVTGQTYVAKSDEGATITTDAGATVKLASLNQVTIEGGITAPGGTVILSGDSISTALNNGLISGYAPPDNSLLSYYTSASKAVWLDAAIDVSGTTLVNTDAALIRTVDGTYVTPLAVKVLDGGKAILSNDTGYVVVTQNGSIDVSGVGGASEDLAQNPNTQGALLTRTVGYSSQTVNSNAGAITIGAAEGLYFDGSVVAHHADTASGGSLTITGEDSNYNSGGATGTYASRIDLIGGDVSALTANYQAGQALPSANQGVLFFAVDKLDDSGIDNFTVGQDSSLLQRFGTNSSVLINPLSIAFVGEINLDLSGTLKLVAPNYAYLSQDAMLAAPSTTNTVNISAAYVSLSAYNANGNMAVGGQLNAAPVSLVADSDNGAPVGIGANESNASLNLTGKLGFDVGGSVVLQNFTQGTSLSTDGDMRLVTSNDQTYLNNWVGNKSSSSSTEVTSAGELLDLSGNLNLTANQIYPASGNSFVIYDASTADSPSTVTIHGTSGSASVPLAAGGSLWIDASNIELANNAIVRAPDGDIVLGFAGTGAGATNCASGSGICYFDGQALLIPLGNTKGIKLAGASVPGVVQTQSVILDAGTTVSVSADGTTIPYGFTSNGKDWKYIALDSAESAIANASASFLQNITATPDKHVDLEGGSVIVNGNVNLSSANGAQVDDLQAQEWVPGTGGTRDVLSATQTSYKTGQAQTVNTYADGRAIYAIMPSSSASSVLGAYDPAFDSAGSGPLVGKTVYLSGIGNLAAGYYTLLPARYATLAGAYRVVQNTAATNVLSSNNHVQTDGSYQVAGYFASGATTTNGGHTFSGAGTGSGSSALSTSFTVQSRDVWEQYSEYTLTSANTYFSELAKSNGTTTPALPRDAGQLVLDATSQLTLGGSVLQNIGTDGRSAEIDIASAAIAIGGQSASGVLTLDAAQLSEFSGAASLLIGGVRSNNGTYITPIATSVEVKNSGTALSAGEVLLAAGQVTVDAGAEITANGDAPVHAGAISFVQDPGENDVWFLHSTLTTTPKYADAAFLAVSNADRVALNTAGFATSALPTTTSVLEIDAGAALTGNAITLAATNGFAIDPSASFTFAAANASAPATALDVYAPSLTLAATNANSAPSLILTPGALNQFGNASAISLNSGTSLNVQGDVQFSFGQSGSSGQTLTISAQKISSDGGQLEINSPDGTLIFNGLASSTNDASGTGTLSATVGQIQLLGTALGFDGFGSINFAAHGSEHAGILGNSSNVLSSGKTFDFGSADVTLDTPLLTVATGSVTALTTKGQLTIDSTVDADTLKDLSLVSAGMGGTLDLNAATVAIGTASNSTSTVSTPAGYLNVTASSGDVTLGGQALLSANGVAKAFFDLTEYAQGGALNLTATTGSINLNAGAQLDFAAATDSSSNSYQGTAGSATLSAQSGAVSIDAAAILSGSGGAGQQGGSFTVDSNNLTSGTDGTLSALASQLLHGGVSNSINLHTRQGVLDLPTGATLAAHTIELTADGVDSNGSSIIIDGVLNASSVNGDAYGNEGGSISLYGARDVTVNGTLAATGSEQGGDLMISTSGTATVANGVNATDATYGYELVNAANAGRLTLGTSAVLDVSSASKGGTITLRAPILDDGSVKLDLLAPNSQIIGERSLALEAYAVWDAADSVGCSETQCGHYFDGYIDPAGWYDNAGNQYNLRNYSDSTGNVYFYSLHPYAAHLGFYAQTLPGFMHSSIISGLETQLQQLYPSLVVRPGIELRNSDANINNGGIAVLTNWNLDAVNLDQYGEIAKLADGGTDWSQFAYRTSTGQAAVLSLHAKGKVDVQASITDGFIQYSNAIGYQAPDASSYAAALTEYQALRKYLNCGSTSAAALCGNDANGVAYISAPPTESVFAGGDAAQIAQYYGLYKEYIDYMLHGSLPVGELTNTSAFGTLTAASSLTSYGGAELPTNPEDYAAYLVNYDRYLNSGLGQNKGTVAVLQAPPETLVPVYTGAALARVDNGISPTATVNNPLALLSETLAGGNSTSYRIVAGADFTTSRPDATIGGGNYAVTVSPSKLQGVNGHYLNEYYSLASTDPNFLGLLNDPILTSTLIRTGTGSIDIVASGDIKLVDTLTDGTVFSAPAIYSAGAPIEGTYQSSRTGLMQAELFQANPTAAEMVVTGVVHSANAGNIQLTAGGSVIATERDGSTLVSALNNMEIGQSWSQWLETGNDVTLQDGSDRKVSEINGTSVNFGGFAQGVMSVGGNVSVTAGQDIRDLSVSLPTTWALTRDQNGNATGWQTYGGGNRLSVVAGHDIASGMYFVSSGSGSLYAKNNIAQSSDAKASVVFGIQDSQMDVVANGNVNVGAVLNPSYQKLFSDLLLSNLGSSGDFVWGGYATSSLQSYSADSMESVASTTGNIQLATALLAVTNAGGSTPQEIAPSSLQLNAYNGQIAVKNPVYLAPSAIGNIDLLADGTISFDASYVLNTSGKTSQYVSYFGLLDTNPDEMASPLNQVGQGIALFDPRSTTSGAAGLHSVTALHADDASSAHIYSVSGDILDGYRSGSYFTEYAMGIELDKSAIIHAGRDIADLIFDGQQVHDSDLTQIIAGRDIYDDSAALLQTGSDSYLVPRITLSGVGTLDVVAGRNIGALTGQLDVLRAREKQGALGDAPITGIVALGNANNPYLAHKSAAISIWYGVADGIALDNFIDAYIDPNQSSRPAGVPSYNTQLIDFVETYEQGLSVDTGLVAQQATKPTYDLTTAWTLFQALPTSIQRQFVGQVFDDVLKTVASDYANSASPYYNQYARGYTAINTLFPAADGYTSNNLVGGSNGASATVDTGDLNIAGTTIQTQQGGDISIFAPGGQAVLGYTSAPPAIYDDNGNLFAGPSTQGILTLETGAIEGFFDRSVLLAQSRIFTEQGGDILLWSSNGDINAGKGAKTTSELTAPDYVCNEDDFCTVDQAGRVSGAGIATLQSVAGAASGDVYLVAPRGTVDAGDAGIRVSGNLIVAAQAVANADNVQVAGKNIGSLNTTPTQISTPTNQDAQKALADQISKNSEAQNSTELDVSVVGLGAPDEEQRKKLSKKKPQ